MDNKKNITNEQAKDTGLAFTLLLLLGVHLFKLEYLLVPAIIVLLITMIWPTLFRPAAKVWFGFSHILGTIMSKVLLTIIFFVIVTPVGLVRKLFGADTLKLKAWKKGSESVFAVRDYTYNKEDLKNPY